MLLSLHLVNLATIKVEYLIVINELVFQWLSFGLVFLSTNNQLKLLTIYYENYKCVTIKWFTNQLNFFSALIVVENVLIV